MKQESIIRYISRLPNKMFIALITLYQKTLSPDHGIFKSLYPNGYCKFHPTCSEYSIEAFKKHGFLGGLYLTVKRVIRCQPFCEGGIDPVPDRIS